MKISQPKFVIDRMKSAYDFYVKQGIAPMQGILRIEADLQNGKGNYKFDIKKDSSLLGPAERSMDQWDIFCVETLMVGLRVEDKTKPGFAPLLTYPFLGDAGITSMKGFDNLDIAALYNGTLSIKTNQVQNLENLPLSHFLYVPETQPSGATQLAQTDLSGVRLLMPENIVFAGTTKHEIEVNFPYTAGSTFYAEGESSYTNYQTKIVFEATGYTIKGGADAAYKVDGNPLKNRF